MIRHIVIINFLKKHNKDFRSLLESTRPYVDQIPSVLSYDIFENKSHYVSDDVISFGVEIRFKDDEGLVAFMKHPKHYEANALFEKYLADPPYMTLTHRVRVDVGS